MLLCHPTLSQNQDDSNGGERLPCLPETPVSTAHTPFIDWEGSKVSSAAGSLLTLHTGKSSVRNRKEILFHCSRSSRSKRTEAAARYTLVKERHKEQGSGSGFSLNACTAPSLGNFLPLGINVCMQPEFSSGLLPPLQCV